jgi:peptidoglycan hydrolase CwlO-like protein
MEITIFVIGLIIALLVIVIIGLGRRLHIAWNQIKEMEMDLSEYVVEARKDAQTITELKRTNEKINKELEERNNISKNLQKEIDDLNEQNNALNEEIKMLSTMGK